MSALTEKRLAVLRDFADGAEHPVAKGVGGYSSAYTAATKFLRRAGLIKATFHANVGTLGRITPAGRAALQQGG